MPYDCWRGMVGMIKPTKGSGSLVELIKMLPDSDALSINQRLDNHLRLLREEVGLAIRANPKTQKEEMR